VDEDADADTEKNMDIDMKTENNVGTLVGTGGRTITSYQDEFDVRIDAPKTGSGTTVAKVQGKKKNVCKCMRKIRLAILKEENLPIAKMIKIGAGTNDKLDAAHTCVLDLLAGCANRTVNLALALQTSLNVEEIRGLLLKSQVSLQRREVFADDAKMSPDVKTLLDRGWMKKVDLQCFSLVYKGEEELSNFISQICLQERAVVKSDGNKKLEDAVFYATSSREITDRLKSCNWNRGDFGMTVDRNPKAPSFALSGRPASVLEAMKVLQVLKRQV
jgi:hypothetical protein